MMLEMEGLRGFAVVVRDDSAELLFPLDFAIRSRREIDIHEEDLMADWELAVNGQNPLPIRGLDQ